MAIPRSWGGKASETRVKPVGIKAPPPRAWRTRKTIRESLSQAMPQRADPRQKNARLKINNFFKPKSSFSQLVVGMEMAKAII